MAFSINRSQYFYVNVKDKPGEAYKLLSRLAEFGVNLLAFTGVPVGPSHTQLTIFPADPAKLIDSAKKASIGLDGPHLALLVQGDDELGALADIHEKLYEANVNVYASTGVSDGRGSFGYLLYIRPDEYERALAALGL
jgi:predicted amino acid-binding ACT domain protein